MLPRPMVFDADQTENTMVCRHFRFITIFWVSFWYTCAGRQVLISSWIYIYCNIKHNLTDLKPFMPLRNSSCQYAYEDCNELQYYQRWYNYYTCQLMILQVLLLRGHQMSSETDCTPPTIHLQSFTADHLQHIIRTGVYH